MGRKVSVVEDTVPCDCKSGRCRGDEVDFARVDSAEGSCSWQSLPTPHQLHGLMTTSLWGRGRVRIVGGGWLSAESLLTLPACLLHSLSLEQAVWKEMRGGGGNLPAVTSVPTRGVGIHRLPTGSFLRGLHPGAPRDGLQEAHFQPQSSPSLCSLQPPNRPLCHFPRLSLQAAPCVTSPDSDSPAAPRQLS